jgi:hypothetical protein
VEALAPRDGPAAMVTGTIWDRTRQEAPSFVVLSDSSGVIRGIGEVYPEEVPTPGGASWVGFINDFDPAARYTAHGVLAGDRAACLAAVVNGPS